MGKIGNAEHANPGVQDLGQGLIEVPLKVETIARAENFSVIQRIALNLLSQDKTTHLGIKNRRVKAGCDQTYLTNLLNQI